MEQALGVVAGLCCGLFAGAALYINLVEHPARMRWVVPTNQRLLALHATGQIGNAEALLARWNALHAVRTALSLVAFVVMLVAVNR